MVASSQHYRPVGRMTNTLVLSLIWWAVVGCAAGISRDSRALVTYQGSFAELQGAPDQHRGQVVMLGGRIIETEPSAQGTEITVLQLPLGGNQKPALDKPSEGRFLIATPEFLDPEVYQKLTPVTVVGEVTGHTIRPIGDFPFTLPILRPIEIKQWPAHHVRGGGPGVHLGVGAGSHGGGAGFGISF